VDLLTPIYEDDRLHPSFKRLLTARTLRSGRLQIEECSARYDDQDGNFVEQFQTTGFDARTFELYINELLFSEVFEHSDKLPYPDFHVSKNNVQIAIECTTANPTQTGKSEIEAYSPINPRDADIDDLVQRLLADAPIQIASPLFSKLNKRFKGVPYWDLPSVKGKPFILAVQTFHEDGALAFSASALAGYLYGVQQTPDWDENEKLVINTHKLEEHKGKKKTIPTGYFDLPDSENISAILWTNAGTIPKFVRMGLQGNHPDKDMTALRWGNRYDYDPNAHAPKPFVHFVGGRRAPRETWGQEAVLFHNPNALNPVPFGLFESVTESVFEEDRPVDYLKSDFAPFFSMTQFFEGKDHRKSAKKMGKAMWKLLQATNQIQNMKDGNPLWDRIKDQISKE